MAWWGYQMKKTLLALSLLAPLSMAQSALADGEDAEEKAWGPLSITATVTSDYRFRGQSQKSRDAALQGSIDFQSETGFFAGVWASGVDFSDTGDTSTFMEVDFYAGYNFTLGEGTEGGIKATYYHYADGPSVIGYDYWEVQASLSHDFGPASLSAEVNYSPEYFFETGEALAVAGGVDVPLSDKFTLSGHVGHQSIDNNGAFGTPDWVYWDLGVSAELGRFTLDVRYVDTNLSYTECFLGTNLCEGGVVGTISLTLP
jgi:uncharacterized protein (TIGR02001 family)